MATPQPSAIEKLVTEGIKAMQNQQTLNGVTVATAAKTFFGLSDKQAAAIGVAYTLFADHESKKELSNGK